MNIGLMIATKRTKQNLFTKKLAEVAGCTSLIKTLGENNG